jgi:DNA repair protein RadC
MSHYNIQQLPQGERPRERLLQYGPEAITSAELIALILGSGSKGSSVLQIAQEILVRFGSLQNFAEASIEELREIKGLGLAKAIQLKASVSLGMRASKKLVQQKFKISNPLYAYHYIKDELEREKREVVMVLLQDAKGFLISHHRIAEGSLTEAFFQPRDVFYPAIRHHACSLILVHNHPSGDPAPSKEDLALTQTLIKAGRVLHIPFNDHLIIGNGSYVSIRQEDKTLWT